VSRPSRRAARRRSVPAGLGPLARRRRRGAPGGLAALGAAAALAACAVPAAPPEAPASPAATFAQAGDAYPVTVDNCGHSVTLAAAPRRILTIKSSVTELVLALGLGDRLVATAFPDGPLPADLAAAPGADAPVLSERVPSHEVVLEAEPDLVLAGWESNFSADGAGERDTLESLGIATYVAPSACKAPGYQPDPLTFDHVFDEIAEAGRLLGAPEAAASLVAEQAARLRAVTPADGGPTALWYSSGSDTPYVGAGIGAPQMIMTAAGLENIAADVRDTWTSLSWEAVADEDPDVIVLVDSDWNTAEHKKDVLTANPTTAALTAVREGRYLVVPFAATEAGVRNVDAVADLVDQLADLPTP
jgi:iron complex transport system substrate-binding protein